MKKIIQKSVDQLVAKSDLHISKNYNDCSLSEDWTEAVSVSERFDQDVWKEEEAIQTTTIRKRKKEKSEFNHSHYGDVHTKIG